ncbi:aryl-sulfate sulfotransferase [Campylobacter jejuni]|nr:aryl-sulfate sulfotransferase [Campylobacter jejuni]KAJ9741348.1 aryl-sulfate sulfotransferase [Campylobacter jejuni]KAJ9743151.1 aryl-sulfate sulfotransferase [Campylobacter jejuni]KAJ9749541.1 aryl-sulfate sulfotransferase [Campylobacter jejuni]KAJ9764661.1 aryl-sulfate sulfotransferase [Campylobacter jejuni]KAJ9766574.1 aryl-sulfate sulfotransferase [Campylobacter jejuni]
MCKIRCLGREIFNRKLPAVYIDFFSCYGQYAKWALFLQQILCVQDSKHVRTVCDTIIEVDENGNVVDDWRLYKILDPYRSTIIKTLDQSAVCLNIDASKVGKTLSDEELAKMDESDKFGDIAGIGRNWAHIKGGIKNFKNIYCNL